MWNKEKEQAIIAAREAGEAIMQVYNSKESLKMEMKADKSPLTEADKKSNDIIVKKLKAVFPKYAILSEEEKDNKVRLDNDYCFVVDPLDGTKEFIKRNGQFTVNIALSYKHKSVMGVIYVPVTKELYYAAQGEGAYVERANGNVERLQVSNNTDRESLKVVVSNSHNCIQMDELLKKYNLTNFVRVGSSLKGCMIAEGKADIYYRFNPTMEWDTAAMQCIVEEAGGIFKNINGTDMQYNRLDSLNKDGFYAINNKENYLL